MASKFIVFEGLDGCGKTTQAKLLCDRLNQKGIKAQFTAEPTNGESGKLIRRILGGEIKADTPTIAALFAADRVYHNQNPQSGINKLLSDGITVVSDRYYYSSMAYQGIDSDFDWVKSINIDCPYIRKPDICIFLEAPEHVCLDRIRAGRDESQIEIYENEQALRKIKQRFDDVFSSLKNENIVRLSAEGSIEDIAERIDKALSLKLF